MLIRMEKFKHYHLQFMHSFKTPVGLYLNSFRIPPLRTIQDTKGSNRNKTTCSVNSVSVKWV